MQRGPVGRARRLSLAVIAAISAAMVAAGCTSGNDVRAVTVAPSSAATSSASTTAGTPTSSSPPALTVPADVPRTGKNLLGAGEKPPVMPLAATRHTSGGALAFAVFFAQTIDWGYATSDPAYMNHYFQPTCLECLNARTGLDSAKQKGAYYRGSRTTITSSVSGAIGGPHGAEFSAVLRLNVTAWDVVDRTGKSLAAGPFEKNLKEEIWVALRGANWTVVDMKTARS